MENGVALILVSATNLRRTRAELSADVDGGRAHLIEDLREAGREAVSYSHSGHYLAFMIAYLMDEEVLPDRDRKLSAALREVRGKRLTDVVPRAGVVLEALDSEKYDVLELRREFHGGGDLSDPRAGGALFDAMRVLSENFERVDEDGALIIAF